MSSVLKSSGLSLASSFRDSLILKRLIAMKRQAKNVSPWKLGLLSALCALLFTVFGCSEELDQQSKDIGSAIKVTTPNAPRYIITDASGKEVDKNLGVTGSSLTGLTVVSEPGENFKNAVPKEATYRIRSMEVIHARGQSPVNRMHSTSEVVDLTAWRPQFKPGDRIVVEIKTVTRRTYQGQDEEVEVKNEVHSVDIK
jgi:hypothetical protein